ncbi:AbrB/MazE/SpoVT family DNA-binding domain-containing protein [Mesorhizobium sp. SB112]|uniref:AbrB/MazE/SpoVT family DNA-binding domain-containing protein n=1 Tax=Mesorhizobium sp. SB112 TaxID=3151853 RepID=UPI003267E17A
MRVTTKGQVTIPKEVRDRLGIEPGSEVDFVERTDGAIELVKSRENGLHEKALLRSLNEWFNEVEGSSDSGLSSDAIMSMTRDRDERNHH